MGALPRRKGIYLSFVGKQVFQEMMKQKFIVSDRIEKLKNRRIRVLLSSIGFLIINVTARTSIK